MGRLQYIIASIVVFSGFHRFSNEEFIIQSFHSHDGPNTGRKLKAKPKHLQLPPLIKNNTVISESTNNKTVDEDYIVGQFCPYCTYNDESLCIDRVQYLMSRYKISEEDAKNNNIVLSTCNTPSLNANVYSHEDEPILILHAGPHKTGTTALQAFMYDLIYANGTIFPRDNLRIPSWDELPGVFGKEGVGLNLPHCSLEDYKNSGGQMNNPMCARMRLAFPQFLRDAYNKSENVLIVAEDLDRKEIDFKRMRFFIRPYNRIKVVVTYRRLHDWLPSFYNQIVEHYILIYAAGEEEYPSFVEWLELHYDEFLQAHAIEVARRYRSFGFIEEVDVINMHEVVRDSNVIDHFFCDHLQAEATCQAIKNGAKPSKSNIGIDHDYQRLAIKASVGGKLTVDLTKPKNLDHVTRGLKEKVKEMELPRVCPRKELLEKIFQTELEHEQYLFPEWFESQGKEEGLRESFDAALEKKLCCLDVDKIFESGMLESIFKELDSSF